MMGECLQPLFEILLKESGSSSQALVWHCAVFANCLTQQVHSYTSLLLRNQSKLAIRQIPMPKSVFGI
jgi:hypothetical protein